MAPDDDGLAQVRGWIADADRIAVLTGAGISAESGSPTFRDAQSGLWAKFDPARLASPEGFAADPALVWGWYASRRDGVRQAQPNAAHRALADWAAVHRGRLAVVTQNVDDLHQRAGSRDVIRLHGDILEDRWFDTCRRQERGEPPCDPASARAGEPPTCADCGNRVRPGVVWFGEPLPVAALDAAEQAARRCALMLVVGTSGAVYPAAGLARTARRHGARVVIVNPHESELDDVADLCLRGPAATLLPRLLA
ncbi:NAD-dependent deacylase [uncultured Methylibium sp.]|uniref:SIR2 family NAD-dependent protein deacylase n=1 Tax=uncultured Methylibium sp. TaxID=381093 RepID=UPI0025E5F8FC|nr:NAD-dependent deacylase [uncultured Methylibium sp.]